MSDLDPQHPNFVVLKLIEISGSVGRIEGCVTGLGERFDAHEKIDLERLDGMIMRVAKVERGTEITGQHLVEATQAKVEELELAEKHRKSSNEEENTFATREKAKSHRELIQRAALVVLTIVVSLASTYAAHKLGMAPSSPATTTEGH